MRGGDGARDGRSYRGGSSELIGCLSELSQGGCLQLDAVGGGDGEIDGECDEIISNTCVGVELLIVVGKSRGVDRD